ncbi:hypothetical protein [Phaeacidiphilus oryzae]|uniref:hypothetical protein n=1 Tax=Phaeacidiphilus oryzae TaxID=348818 RepID=UPI0005646A59|nr:hypothetical protein [Phaeacidiphilus oryzae]
MPITEFPPPLGTLTMREDLAAYFETGATAWQGGIVANVAAKVVCIFSDPAKGERHGYTFDGWTEPDEHGSLYWYTGAGSRGPQQLSGDNAKLLKHREKDRRVFLFVAAGKAPGRDAVVHRYVGEFVVDPDEPYEELLGRDADRLPRRVYVFRLRPKDPALVDVRESDAQQPAQTSDALFMPDFDMTPRLGPVEFHGADETEMHPAVGPRRVDRREGRLRSRFAQHLEALGHQVGSFQLTIPGESRPFPVDLYDATDHVLFEIKSKSKRNEIRMALGQLLDYRRHIPGEDLRTAILLPEEPSEDLTDLIHQAGVHLVYQDGEGFEGLPLT